MGTQGFWKDAFTVAAAEPLNKDDETWLDSIAEKLSARSLAQPAILFLESTKPVHFLAGQAVRFVDPIFSLVIPEHRLQRFAELLENRKAAERLIKTLERQEASEAEPKSPTPDREKP
ncbi:MAG: hypothetical protein HY924_09420 [Elusimicrobia bacterium]|nr:hypothetical protein [Elusimicrobiota bacterium]